MAHDLRSASATIVQFAEAFLPADEGWQTSPRVIPIAGSETVGASLGQCQLSETLGGYVPPGYVGNRASDFRTSSLRKGMCVRLLKQDPAGSITGLLINKSVTFSAFWWGTIVGRAREVTGGDDVEALFGQSRELIWTCEDVGGILARHTITYAFVDDGTKAVSCGAVPAFNETIFGNCGASRTIDGTSANAFLRGTGSTRWTLSQALTNVLASYGRPLLPDSTFHAGPVRFRLDPSTASTYASALQQAVPRIESEGRTVDAVLSDLLPAARGLTWKWVVAGGFANMTLIALNPVAIGSIPANTPLALDLRANHFTDNLSYIEDATGFDYIEVIGERPTRIVTLSYPADLEPDPSWTTASPSPDAAGDKWGEIPDWRVYRIKPSWLATGLLRNKLASSPDGIPDGVRTWSASLPAPLLFLTVTDDLGTGRGFVAAGDPQPPVLHLLSAAAPRYIDQSQTLGVRALNDPPGIEIGSTIDAGAEVKAASDLAAGQQVFYVTIGIKEWAPLKIAWRRDRSRWPGSAPRVHQVRVSDAMEVSAAAGYMPNAAYETTGIPPTLSAFIFQVGLTGLSETLQVLRARYETEGGTLSWTDAFYIDTTTTGVTSLGAMVGTCATPEGTENVNAIISMRSWDFIAGSTSYTTLRPVLLDTTVMA